MAMVEVDDGVDLWVETTGGGEGLPLVLCHGGPGMWDNLGSLASLLDHERLVVRWDQRGCGRSGGAAGPFTLERSIADLAAVRRHLGIDRWIVGGHSWGASLALRAVLAEPAAAAGLLYVSGTGLGTAWRSAYKSAAVERLTADQLSRLLALESMEHRSPEEEVEWRSLRWAPEFADRHRALELASIDAAAPWSVNLECNATIGAETKRWDFEAVLTGCRSIGVPTLLVHGADDPRPPFAIDDLAGAIPDAEVTVVDHAGHYPWLERPGAVASAVRPFLRRCDAAAT